MKSLFTILLTILYIGNSYSQSITITTADMPASGDTIRYSSSASVLNYDTTGAGMRWDYSSLMPNGQGVDSFLLAVAVNPLYALSFGLTDFGLKAAGTINLGTTSLSNIYNFYKNSSTKYTIEGTGVTYQGLPLASVYTIKDKVYQFPLQYGRVDTSAYEYKITVPTFATVHVIGTRYNQVDGWGTVLTPYDSFNCIRMKARTDEVDSITLTAFGGFTIATPRSTTTYQWLANGKKIPVLEVVGRVTGTTFAATQIRYIDRVRFIPPQFTELADFTANKTICTTADTVRITNRNRPNPAGTKYLYTITPTTFSYYYATNDSVAAPVVMFHAPGLYTVSLHVESPAGGSVPAVADTTKVDYISVTQYNGIADIAALNTLQVYPNPATDYIECSLAGSGTEAVAISLIDVAGHILYTVSTTDQSHSRIPVAHLAMGNYVLNLTTAHGTTLYRKVQIGHSK